VLWLIEHNIIALFHIEGPGRLWISQSIIFPCTSEISIPSYAVIRKSMKRQMFLNVLSVILILKALRSNNNNFLDSIIQFSLIIQEF